MNSANLRKQIERKIARRERFPRKFAKPGVTYHFGKSGDVYRTKNVAPFLPSSPVINGVRMRYENGKLVPRAK